MAIATSESRAPVGIHRPRFRWLSGLRLACPLVVVAVSGWDLVRWLPGRAGPGFDVVRPMASLTAFGFLWLGIAFCLRLAWAERRIVRLVSSGFLIIVAAGGAHVIYCRVFNDAAPAWEKWLVPNPVLLLGSRIEHMRGWSVGFLLLSAFGVFALVPPRSRWQDVAVATVLLSTIFAAVTVVSYAAGNPPLASGGWLDVAPLASFAFIVFNFGLLLTDSVIARLREWILGREASRLPPTPFSRGECVACGLLAVIGVSAIVTGIVYLRVETARQQERAWQALETLTTLKVGQIEQWRRERLGDGRMVMQMPLLTEAVRATAGAGPAEGRADLARWLKVFRENYGYVRLVVLDAEMNPLMAEPDTPALPDLALPPGIASLRGLAGVRELAPYVDRSGQLHWDLLVPLQGADQDTALGAILLQSDPMKYLGPVVHSWPAEYQTGQTVLWDLADDGLSALVGFRPLPGTTPEEQRPFGRTRSLSDPQSQSMLTRAIRGLAVEHEELDYRGVKIIGSVHPIPNSTWWLSSRVESSEIYSRLRRDSVGVAGILAGLLAITGLTTVWLWRRRQQELLHERLIGELEQKRLAARLGAVMRHAKDIILVLDEKLQILEANQQALETYGWTKEEMRRMNARDLRQGDTDVDYSELMERATKPEGVIFESIHRRKGGPEFPVEISARQVEVEGQRQFLAIVRDITERRRVEGELRASQERYRLIAENTSDVIWLYDLRAEQFAYISPSVFALRGYLPEEIVGRRLAESLTPESAEVVGRLIQKEFSAFAAGDHSRKHVIIEVEQLRKDGSVVPTEVVATLLADANGAMTQILGISRNITERRRMREAREKFNAELEQRVVTRTAELATRNNEIQALLDSIPDTVMLFDEKGALRSFHAPDRPAATLHPIDGAGSAREEGYERMALEIAHDMHASMSSRRQATVQEFDRTLNGKAVSIEARATPAGADRLLILLRDISNRKRIERDILANLDREKQLSEMKSQFLSVASHEFRTPLAAAVGTLDLIERHGQNVPAAKRTELLARIRTALHRLTTIMNDVLSLSRADSGRIKVNRMEVNLGVFVQDTIREVEAGDQQKHRFVFEQSGSPATVPADTSLLHHILSNLVGNAVRYSPPGSTVAVSLQLETGSFSITVTDEGIGVPEAERDRVFEPFVRGSNVGHIGGTGLGLNIVKRYTELMGGTIELLPTGRGAAFRIIIPLTQPST